MKLTDQDIIREAQDNLTLSSLYEKEIRAESTRCMKFLALEQWEQSDLDARAGRISVAIDQIGQYLDQTLNDWRRNRLGIKVSPADSAADEETARIIDGLIRQVEYQSKAHIAYDHAFECMAGGNRGFCQITTRRRPGTFKQDIRILKIPNPDSVYDDPFYTELDTSDRTFCIKTEVMSRKTFKKRFPKAAIVDFSSASQLAPSWFPDAESLIVAEYWRVEERMRRIQLLTKPIAIIRNNRAQVTDTVYDDEYEELPEGVEIARNSDGELMEDEDAERIVYCYLLNGAEVLEKTRWLGQFIPIIPWYGKEIWYEGKKKLFSLISRSLDAQKGNNYAYSSLFERLGQQIRTPVMGYVGQFKTQRQAWMDAATKPVAFLEVDPLAIGDHPAPFPARADFDPRIDQTVLATSVIKDATRGTMGINTSILGQDTGKAKSGVAIKELGKEGDNATYTYPDNGGRAVELCGTMILDLIPHIYDEAEIIHIRDEQQKVLAIAINQDIQQMQNPPEGQQQNHFLTEGKYQVNVSAAPSHESLRKEGEEMIQTFIDLMDPQMRQKAIPVALRLSDKFGAHELADAMDPPKKKFNAQQAAQQMQKMGQMVQMLTKEVHALSEEREAKTLELASQEKQTAIRVLGQIRVAEISASKDLDKAAADRDASQLEQIMTQAHEVGMQAEQMAGQQQTQESQQAHER